MDLHAEGDPPWVRENYESFFGRDNVTYFGDGFQSWARAEL